MRRQEFLTGLLEHAPTPIYATAIDGRRLLVNRAWEELWRLPREEVIGLAWEERLPPEQARRFRDQNRQVIDTAAPLVLEEEVETPDGRHLSLYTVKFPVRDAAGRIGAVGGISFDISERKRAEAKLVEWTNRYDAAVEATGQILYDWDTASDFVTFGGSCEAILGYSCEELSGGLDRWVELIHPEDREAFAAEIERVRSTKQAFHLEYRVRHRDGSYLTVRDEGRFFLNPDGTPARMVGFVADITERRRMEEALREGQATLRTFYDSAPLAMGVVDIHGDDLLIVSANQATADLLGVPVEYLQDRYASQVGLSSELLAYWIERYRESGRLGGPVRFEYEHRMARGTAVARLGRLPDLRGPGGSGTIRLRRPRRSPSGSGRRRSWPVTPCCWPTCGIPSSSPTWKASSLTGTRVPPGSSAGGRRRSSGDRRRRRCPSRRAHGRSR